MHLCHTVFLTVVRQYEEAHIVNRVDCEEHGLLPAIPIIPEYTIFCVGAIYSNDVVYSATVLRQLIEIFVPM